MKTLTDAVRSLRARPLIFELENRVRVVIPPPSLAQAAACVQLDPVPGVPESAADEVLRFAQQARILLGPKFEHLIDELQPLQIAEIVGALYVSASGVVAPKNIRSMAAKGQRELGNGGDSPRKCLKVSTRWSLIFPPGSKRPQREDRGHAAGRCRRATRQASWS